MGRERVKAMPDAAEPRAGVLPVVSMLGAMISVQFGAALAQRLFPLVGPEGAVSLRVGLAALLLLVLRRPSLRAIDKRGRWAIIFYGLTLGAMNLTFYFALQRIPLGIAVAVEFVGPMAVAAFSRGRGMADLAWLGLAAVGLIALAPIGQQSAPPDTVGLLLALAAGVFWALYIIFGGKAGKASPKGAVALGMAVGVLVVLPFGIARAGPLLVSPNVLPMGLAVAVLSSALPYSLEIFALTRLPKVTYGALASLAPALAALSGWLVLGQALSLRQMLAIGCVVAASAGATSRYLADRAEAAPETA
jgi:inner membrane transporter RhtA